MTDPYEHLWTDPEELFDQRVFTAEWLETQEFPPLEWAVEDLLPEGMGLLAGSPKMGKSWLIADIAVACAMGGMALGCIAVKQRPVLYLALEDGQRRLKDRLQILTARQPLPNQLSLITVASRDEAPLFIDVFLSRNKDKQPLVILDTLGKIKGARRANQDSYQADYDFGTTLKDAADLVPGACIVAVHHTRKMGSADFLDLVSGTQGLAGSVDFVIVMQRARLKTQGTLQITGRDVSEAKYAIESNGGKGWRLSGGSLTEAAKQAELLEHREKISVKQQKTLSFVNARSETTPKELAEHLGIDNNTASTELSRLVDKGLIGKKGHGVYIPLPDDDREVSEPSDCRNSEPNADRRKARAKVEQALREAEAAKKELDALCDPE